MLTCGMLTEQSGVYVHGGCVSIAGHPVWGSLGAGGKASSRATRQQRCCFPYANELMASLGLAVTQQLQRGSPGPGGAIPTAARWVTRRLCTHMCMVCMLPAVCTSVPQSVVQMLGAAEGPVGAGSLGKRGLHTCVQTCANVHTVARAPAPACGNMEICRCVCCCCGWQGCAHSHILAHS